MLYALAQLGLKLIVTALPLDTPVPQRATVASLVEPGEARAAPERADPLLPMWPADRWGPDAATAPPSARPQPLAPLVEAIPTPTAFTVAGPVLLLLLVVRLCRRAGHRPATHR